MPASNQKRNSRKNNLPLSTGWVPMALQHSCKRNVLTLIPFTSSSSKEPMSKASAALTSPLGGIKGGGYFCRYTWVQSMPLKKGCSFTSCALQTNHKSHHPWVTNHRSAASMFVVVLRPSVVWPHSHVTKDEQTRQNWNMFGNNIFLVVKWCLLALSFV